MASVRSTTPRRSPRAAHRSSEDQYGLIMAQARGSVRRKLILGGPSEWFLFTSRHGRLHLWHHRRAAIAATRKRHTRGTLQEFCGGGGLSMAPPWNNWQ